MMETSAFLELENDIKNFQDEALPHYINITMPLTFFFFGAVIYDSVCHSLKLKKYNTFPKTKKIFRL